MFKPRLCYNPTHHTFKEDNQVNVYSMLLSAPISNQDVGTLVFVNAIREKMRGRVNICLVTVHKTMVLGRFIGFITLLLQ